MNDFYKNNFEKIKKYLKEGECSRDNAKVGMEVEHFITDKKTSRSITYYEEDGVKNVLERIKSRGSWSGIYEKENIVGLSRDGSTITLEPGAQIEVSVKPFKSINDIEKEYSGILQEIKDALNNNHEIKVMGYQPKSKIKEIPFIPKERYNYMEKYLSQKGKYALNMMKGTASTQVSIDFFDEIDFTHKFRVANFLAPLIYSIFDNSCIFEGKKWDKNALRVHVWNNCDKDRSGIIKGSLDGELGYSEYARYIIEGIPIIAKKSGEFIYTEDRVCKDIYKEKEMEIDEIEHILSMFFPDVRAKKYIEIRMADALEYPYCISYAAFIKGIFYSPKILNKLYKDSLKYGDEDINRWKDDVMENGVHAIMEGISLHEYALDLMHMVKEELKGEEKYIDNLILWFESRIKEEI